MTTLEITFGLPTPETSVTNSLTEDAFVNIVLPYGWENAFKTKLDSPVV